MGEHERPEESLRERLRHLTDQNPQHAVSDGHLKGWNAADIDPSEYSSDDYAAQFPEVSDGPVEV